VRLDPAKQAKLKKRVDAHDIAGAFELVAGARKVLMDKLGATFEQ
jgi:hypothetical protein